MKLMLVVVLNLLLLLSCSEEDFLQNDSEEAHIQSFSSHYSSGIHSDPESQQPHYVYYYCLEVELQLSTESVFNLRIGSSNSTQKTDTYGYYKESFGDFGSTTVCITLANGESQELTVSHDGYYP